MMNIQSRKTFAISALALTLGAISGTVFTHTASAQVAPPAVPQTPGAASPADGTPGNNGKSPSSTATQTTTTTTQTSPSQTTPNPTDDATRLGNRRPLDRPSNLPGQSPNTPSAPNEMEGSASGTAAAPFGKFDTNADGKISRDEMRADAKMSRKFQSMDRNRDGYLSTDEYSVDASVTTKRKS